MAITVFDGAREVTGRRLLTDGMLEAVPVASAGGTDVLVRARAGLTAGAVEGIPDPSDLARISVLAAGGTYDIAMGSVLDVGTNGVAVVGMGGYLERVANGGAGTVLLGGTAGGGSTNMAFGQITNSHVAVGAAIAASKISGLAAIATSGSASDLGTGTIPLARISGLTDTQIDAAAAIAWSKISKAGSSLADLATRSAGALNSGNLPAAQLPTGSVSWSMTALVASGPIAANVASISANAFTTQVAGVNASKILASGAHIWYASDGSTIDAQLNHTQGSAILGLTGGLTISSTLAVSNLVTITRQAANLELLQLNTERAWSFFQRSTGASTDLALVSYNDNKGFRIQAANGTPSTTFVDNFTFFTAYTTPGNSYFNIHSGTFQMGGTPVITAGKILQNVTLAPATVIAGGLRLTSDATAIAAGTTPTAVATLQQALIQNEEGDAEWVIDYTLSVGTDVLIVNVTSTAGTLAGTYSVEGGNGAPDTGVATAKQIVLPVGTALAASANCPGNLGSTTLKGRIIVRASVKQTVAGGTLQLLLRAVTTGGASSGTLTVKTQSELNYSRVA